MQITFIVPLYKLFAKITLLSILSKFCPMILHTVDSLVWWSIFLGGAACTGA